MGHTEIVDLLYPVSDVQSVLQFFQETGETSKGISYLERLFKAEQDKEFLKSNLLSEKASKNSQVNIKKL